ncbi:MAG: hypothetical protein ABIT09_11530 [Croceibacterium sp.]
MSPAARYSLIGSGVLAALLSGCAAGPRLYLANELQSVAGKCRLAESDVDQLGDPRFLFLLKPAPSKAELACVSHWAARHHLHLVFIQSITPPPGPSDI